MKTAEIVTFDYYMANTISSRHCQATLQYQQETDQRSVNLAKPTEIRRTYSLSEETYFLLIQQTQNKMIVTQQIMRNKTGTSKVGAIFEARKAQSIKNMPRTFS